MRLLALSMVKNERDVIELFVRHNLQYADGLLVIDNGSTDGTREILADFTARGEPVAVIDDPGPAYLQSERMTALFRRAVRAFDADFVIPLDADEFLRVGSREGLERALAALPADHWANLPWQTYVLRPEDVDAPGDLFQRIRWRRRIDEPGFGKVVIPARAPWAGEMIVSQGYHALRLEDGRSPPQAPIEGVSVAHFPVRGASQIEAKIFVGWLACLARDPAAAQRERGLCYHWYDVYRVIAGRRPSADEVARISLHYAQGRDPLAPFEPDRLVEDPMASDAKTEGESPPIDVARSVVRAAEAALSSPPEATLAIRRQRRWPWQRRRRQLSGMEEAAARSGEGQGARILWDAYRPASLLEIGESNTGVAAALEQCGAERCTRLAPTQAAGGDSFDLVLAWGAGSGAAGDEDAFIETAARHARRAVLLAPDSQAESAAALSRWRDAGFAPCTWLGLALRALAPAGSTLRRAIVLEREPPGRRSKLDWEAWSRDPDRD